MNKNNVIIFCLVCENKIESFNPNIDNKGDYNNLKKKSEKLENINKDYFNSGLCIFDSPGFGSKHDMDRFILGICDSCITKKLEEGLIVITGNDFEGTLDDDDFNDLNNSYIKRCRDSKIDDILKD